MKKSNLATTSRACLLAAAALFVGASQAAPVPLQFVNGLPYVSGQHNDSDVGGFGSGCTDGCDNNMYNFANVAPTSGLDIDATVTWSIDANTNFMTTDRGLIPDYNSTTSTDDLAFLYDGVGLGNHSGVALTITFYEGGGTYSTPYTIDEFNLLIYDVDGSGTIADAAGFDTGNVSSAHQDEYFDAFLADGLYSYTLGNSAQALTATPFSGGVRFDGPGGNYAENDATGAVILNYRNSSQVTLDFGSYQHLDSAFPTDLVFTAIDGNIEASTGPWEDPVVVPVPAAVWLFGSGLLGLVGIARRKNV